MRKRTTVLAAIAAALAFATMIFVGCASEVTNPPPAAKGAVAVDVDPDGLDAAWTLTTPSGGTHHGVDDSVLTDLTPGTYDLEWSDVLGFHTPPDRVFDVTSGDTTHAWGLYIVDPNAAGVVHIVVESMVRTDEPLRWVLKVQAGAGEFDVTGEGDMTIEDIPPGFLTIDWQPVPDWVEPHDGQFDYTLASTEELTVVGVWTPRAPLSMEMVRVEAGTFVMGAPEWEMGYKPPFYTQPLRPEDEAPQHDVWLQRALLVSTTEVTQYQYDAVMGATTWNFGPSPNLPAEGLTWVQALQFCNALSLEEGLTPAYDIVNIDDIVVDWDQEADGYRLPTEAEWEYLCRGERPEAFNFGPITAVIDPDEFPTPDPLPDPVLDRIGWYRDAVDAPAETRPVASRLPNEYGLFDVHGNVAEWCWDRYGATWYDDALAIDPTGPETGDSRVLRGGSYIDLAQDCRSASRAATLPQFGLSNTGLRVVRWADAPPSADKPLDKD